MSDSGSGVRLHRRKNAGIRPRTWCCSFSSPPQSPDLRIPAAAAYHHGRRRSCGGGGEIGRKFPPKPQSSAHSSSPSSKLSGLGGLIDPRRILSPGRVSPIDTDPFDPLPEIAASVVESEPEAPDLAAKEPERVLLPVEASIDDAKVLTTGERCLDLKLRLKGNDGKGLVLEMDSATLCKNSVLFSGIVQECAGGEVDLDGVEDLDAFRDTMELMLMDEKYVDRWLVKIGVSHAIAILEVCSVIGFDRGTAACLRYIDAVPWIESEEDKLKNLFARCTFDEAVSKDALSRLRSPGSSTEDLAMSLISGVVRAAHSTARKEMQTFVNGLLCKSSVYQKDPAGLNKESLYEVCQSCLTSLVSLFEEAVVSSTEPQRLLIEKSKPLIERISKQTENLSWLLEIIAANEMGEEFVELWASQDALIRMHGKASPMVRYELSRVSAGVFIALGKGKLHCPGEVRCRVFEGWFEPLVEDFGWLQRCSKGLDVRMLEDALGQALLTLPLQRQQSFFEAWFTHFASRGLECPNLGRAFQVWWRRLFLRSSESRW